MLESTAYFFKALSEPLRIRIINILLHHDSVCVCDLVTLFDLQQGTVSRHLSYLKKANIVESQSKGTWRYYTLNHTLLAQKSALFSALKSDFEQQLTLQQDLKTFNQSVCGA